VAPIGDHGKEDRTQRHLPRKAQFLPLQVKCYGANKTCRGYHPSGPRDDGLVYPRIVSLRTAAPGIGRIVVKPEHRATVHRYANVRNWGDSRRAAFPPDTWRSASRQVEPIDRSGTAKSGGLPTGSFGERGHSWRPRPSRQFRPHIAARLRASSFMKPSSAARRRSISDAGTPFQTE
jgi:hypothetical protein